MSSYPGEDPQPADQGSGDPTSSEGATGSGEDPSGYWERRAAEQAREQEQQGHPTDETGPITPSGAGPVFNPSSAQGATDPGQGGWSGSESYGAPQQPSGQPTYGQQYGQQQYAQPSYGDQSSGQYAQQGYDQQQYGQQPPYGQQQYAQPAYGQAAYAQQPYGAYAPGQPKQSQATMAMILGIVGLALGVLMCGLGLLVSPFAWAMGRSSLREIRASEGQLGGETEARAGMVTGIIGTVLLVLALLALVAFVVVLVVAGVSSSGNV